MKQVRTGNYPKVYFLHGYLKDEEVSSLYKHPKVKGLISLTHGEGFGLPLLEAAACGLPICATNWSAHTEFLNLGKWKKLKGRIETIPAKKIDQNIFVEGAKWANVDLGEARKSLTEFIDEGIPDSDVIALRDSIRKAYSFKKISEKYDKFFKRWK